MGNFKNDIPHGGQILYYCYQDEQGESDSPVSPSKTLKRIWAFYGILNEGKIGSYGAYQHFNNS